jgi:hypothetical protein
MAMATTCTIMTATRWQVSKRAVVVATMRAMARVARVMAAASERALMMATNRAMETEGEGNGDGGWWGKKGQL